MATGDVTAALDDLLKTLELKAAKRREDGRGDAIDVVLSSQPRTTRVASLRDAAEVKAFREALIDGLIQVDTANQLLQLVNALIVRLVV